MKSGIKKRRIARGAHALRAIFDRTQQTKAQRFFQPRVDPCYKCSMPGVYHCEYPRCGLPLTRSFRAQIQLVLDALGARQVHGPERSPIEELARLSRSLTSQPQARRLCRAPLLPLLPVGSHRYPAPRQLESYVVLGHRSYRNQVEVLLHSSESRQGLEGLSPDLHWAITDASTAQAFGDITAVPTLFLFNRSGKTSRVVYGAPPDLQ
jgi:hypothetical protein